MTDRLGCKAVLSVSGSLMTLVTLCWTFTTMPERHAFTLPMLAALHVFYGIGTAGVNVAMGAIDMKLAPEGNATPYLAGTSLAANLERESVRCREGTSPTTSAAGNPCLGAEMLSAAL